MKFKNDFHVSKPVIVIDQVEEADTVPLQRPVRAQPVRQRPAVQESQRQPVQRPFPYNLWDRLDKQQVAMLAFGIGVFIGLVVLGWHVWPVQWIIPTPTIADLPAEDKIVILNLARDVAGYDPTSVRITELVARWGEVGSGSCGLAGIEPDPVKKAQFKFLAERVGVECFK